MRARPVWHSGRHRATSVRRIMVVDDDRLYLRGLRRLLRSPGYSISTFERPESALEMAPWLRPDLAILDIMMPGLSGLDLAEEIQEATGSRIPVILLSALSTDRDITRGYRRGAWCYLTKPCDPREVLGAVRRGLRQADRADLLAGVRS